MTLILLDGLEDFSSTSSLQGSPTIAAARTGNGVSTAGSSTGPTYTIPSAQESDTITLGFACKISTLAGALSAALLNLASDAGVTSHINLAPQASGAMQVLRGASTQLGLTATGLIVANTWFYIELQVKLHDTTGTVLMKINGVVVLNLTAQDTKNAGTKTTFDTVKLTGVQSATTLLDDFYLMTGASDTPLGDIAVETLYPNGDGNANAWLGSDGNSVSNWQLVDEPIASPVDYVGSATSGQQDMYTLTDLVHTTGTVVGVCHAAYVAKTDTATRQVKLVNRRTTDTKSAALDVPAAYGPIHYALATDPETSAAWTIANVNSLQSGIEVV